MSVLTLIYSYGSLLALAAIAILAVLYLPSPFKVWVVGGAVALLMLDIGYARGLHVANAQCLEASKKLQAEIVRRDFEITTKQQQLDEALAAAQEAAETQTEQKVIVYEKQLVPNGACSLSDGDRQRLLDIR